MITRFVLPIAGFGFSRNLSIRTLLGAWGLAVFVIGNHYTSLLTAFITAPNPQPLIRSIYELQTRPDLRLVSNADRNTAAVLLVKSHYLMVKMTDDENETVMPSSQQILGSTKFWATS